APKVAGGRDRTARRSCDRRWHAEGAGNYPRETPRARHRKNRVNAAKKVAASGNAQGQVDVDGYRGKVADAVGIEVGDLVAQGRDNPRAAMLRMIAAYFLLQQDRLSVGDIARIMDTTESWVRSSTSYIARRVNSYTAF